MTETQEQYDVAARRRREMKNWIPFLTSSRITYYMQQFKKLYYEQYIQVEEKLLRQLNFAKAVETDEAPHDLKYGGLQHTSVFNIIADLRKKEHLTEYEKKLMEFAKIQYEHVMSLRKKTYKQSPYYQEKSSAVQQIHSMEKLELLNELIERLRLEQKRIFTHIDETPVDDHLVVLQMIHRCFGKEYEMETNKQQLSQRKESQSQSRKRSNLETAIELRKSYENLCARVKNKNKKQNNSTIAVNSSNIGIEPLPLTPVKQKNLEYLSIKQLIKEYKLLQQERNQETNKEYRKEVAEYLETIFNKAQKDETTILQHRCKTHRDKQEVEEELREKIGVLIKENLDLNKKIEEIITENQEIKLKLTNSLQMEKKLEEQLEEEKQEKLKLNKSLNKKENNEKQHLKIKELNEEIQKLQEQLTITIKQTKEKKTQTEHQTKTVEIQTQVKTKETNIQTEITISDPEQQQSLELQEITNRLRNIENIILENAERTNRSKQDGTKEVENNEGDQLRTSSSALILKITSKNITITQLKETLNERLLSEKNVPPLFCKNARQRNTLILQSDNEENTEKLLKLIENYSDIKQQIEITYKLTKNSKVIITGIPKTVSSSTIINYITEQTPILNINIEKILQKEKTNNYHMVLNMESKEAQLLLNKKFLLIGLNTCQIRFYRPIIRCGNCQLYGHSTINCLRDSICAKCSRGHHTSECPYAQDSSQHRCTNCYLSEGYKKHTADSNLCPVFRAMLADRRTN